MSSQKSSGRLSHLPTKLTTPAAASFPPHVPVQSKRISKDVLKDLATLRVMINDPLDKPGAMDNFLKEMLTTKTRDAEYGTRFASSPSQVLFVLIAADSDYASEVRAARHAGIHLVMMHEGNSRKAYDSLLPAK